MGRGIDISSLRNDYQFFDAFRARDRRVRGNCNLLAGVRFHELGWGSPILPGGLGAGLLFYGVWTVPDIS